MQSFSAVESISFLKSLASNGEHSLMSGSMGGRYHGIHFSASFMLARAFTMLHSSLQATFVWLIYSDYLAS